MNTPERISRENILEAARRCVCDEREQDYGSPEDSFKTIAGLWQAYLCAGGCLAPEADLCIRSVDVAAMLALLKIARIASGHAKVDNWVDLAGYAACGGELESR